MFDIISSAGNVKSDFFGKKDVKHSAVLVISSDKGLAGGYNANVFKQVNKVCKTLRDPLLITIGNIASRHFNHSSFSVLENFSFMSRLPSLDDAGQIADYIISQFLWNYFDEVHLVYTHMFSAVKLTPETVQLLPISAEKIQEEIAQIGGEKRVDLRFEYIPSEEEVFDALVPIYIKGIIYGALVEAYASEQNARMTAMDEASQNAEDMLAKLQIFYNRARQASITQEMTEIIGGSSAING
jgi:F-type H+-transporting ATPase subunit gamma